MSEGSVLLITGPSLRHCQNWNVANFERKLSMLLPRRAFNQSLKLGFLLNETLKYLTYINLIQLSESWCHPSLQSQVTKHCINPCLGKETLHGIAPASIQLRQTQSRILEIQWKKNGQGRPGRQHAGERLQCCPASISAATAPTCPSLHRVQGYRCRREPGWEAVLSAINLYLHLNKTLS